MKKGFTLAEVLITLAIIGVVAALTIPVVVHKYQQKAMYTQFMKVYNTLLNAIDLSVADNGSPENWTFDGSNPGDVTEQFILPYLKVSSKCNTSDSSCANYNIAALTGDDLGANYGELLGVFAEDSTYVYTLADGSTVAFAKYGSNAGGVSQAVIFFDINGVKAPNTLGRDIFGISYDYNCRNVGDGKYECKWAWDGGYEKGGQVMRSGSMVTIPSNCDPGSASVSNGMPNGFGCGGRLLLEGKMDY